MTKKKKEEAKEEKKEISLEQAKQDAEAELERMSAEFFKLALTASQKADDLSSSNLKRVLKLLILHPYQPHVEDGETPLIDQVTPLAKECLTPALKAKELYAELGTLALKLQNLNKFVEEMDKAKSKDTEKEAK